MSTERRGWADRNEQDEPLAYSVYTDRPPEETTLKATTEYTTQRDIERLTAILLSYVGYSVCLYIA